MTFTGHRTIMSVCFSNDDFFFSYDNGNWTSELANYWLLWKPFLPSNAETTFLRGGYYSVSIKPDLRVIVLNTVLYTPRHDLVRLLHSTHIGLSFHLVVIALFGSPTHCPTTLKDSLVG